MTSVMSISARYDALATRWYTQANALAIGLAREAGYGFEAELNAWRFLDHPAVEALRARATFAAFRSAHRAFEGR